jgi:four helix bundle protein
MNYQEWEKTVPVEITNDSLWKMEAYRLGLFLSDLCWYDVTKLLKDRRTVRLSDQLYRSSGSVSANLAEGYSRGTGKDRARFYEYALGSARECRDWYYKGRHILETAITKHRIEFVTQIIKLLLKMVPEQRKYKIKEPIQNYKTTLDDLFNNVPLP